MPSLTINDAVLQTGYREYSLDTFTLFNQASNNAIILAQNEHEGYQLKGRTGFNLPTDIENRVDIDNPTELAVLKGTDGMKTSPKMVSTTNPIKLLDVEANLAGYDFNTLSLQQGRQAAQIINRKMFDTAVAALHGALSSDADAQVDGTEGDINRSIIDGFKSQGLGGDDIEILIGSPDVYYEMMKEDLNFSGDTILGGIKYDGTVGTMGRVFIASNALNSYTTEDTTAGTTTYQLMGLRRSALLAYNSMPVQSRTAPYVGYSDGTGIQIQYDYGITADVKGYSWTGPQNPENSALDTGTNWNRIASDVSGGPGFLLNITV